jgi:hypothetical protein
VNPGKKAPGGPCGLRAFSFLLGVLLLPAVSAVAEAADPPALSAALASARAGRLAEQKAWLRLGHYRGHTGAYRSEADGPALFLAPTGAHDPEAELEATLRAFYAPVAQTAAGLEAHDPRNRPALCRFPARFLWLLKAVPLRPEDVPAVRCPELEEFITRLNPRSAVLVFSSYFLNNPASAFGHTFLRLRNAQPGSHDLLDYGIDFSADVNEVNAVLYAVKGVMGFFPGTFKRLPYYYKVREYNDYESRDLWEYELNLSSEALMMLVAHIWELGSTYFDYYYLDENCSYHILGVLEAADPQLDLLSHVGFPVIPADTVKALFANKKLVRDVRFRPSIRSQLRERLRLLSASEKSLVSGLAANPAAALPPEMKRTEQATVLDAAIDLVDVRYGRKLLEKSDAQPAELKQALLGRRAALGIATAAPVPVPPATKRPERSHASARAGTAFGATSKREAFQSIDLRLALQDLSDPTQGLPEGAQLEFMATRLRLWPEARRVDVEDFAAVRVGSLTPIDRFDLQPSWMASIGAATRRYDCDSCLAGRGLITGGGAFGLGRAGMLFAMGGAEALYGPYADWRLHLRGGLVATAGMLLRGGPVALLATGEAFYYPFQSQPRRLTQTRAVLRWVFRADYALAIEGGLNEREADGRIGALVYF